MRNDERKRAAASRVSAVLSGETPARPAPILDTEHYGYRGPDGFTSLDDFTVIAIPPHLFRRLDALHVGGRSDKVAATLPQILAARLELDFPGSTATVIPLTKRGDLAVRVSGTDFMASDRDFLQGRLNEVSERLAGCLGV